MKVGKDKNPSKMPTKDLNELIAWLKGNPNRASTAVTAASQRLTALLFQKETGTRFALVPYRGGGPAMRDLGLARCVCAEGSSRPHQSG
jgi:tripartite-type tricarboxylate transporter receptor subunit TctC